jgi:hypothetical protein
MPLTNCPQCGKLFAGIEELCKLCLKQEEIKFRIVKQYIHKNPKTTIIELAEKTGIDTPLIMKFIKRGSIQINLENH